MADPSQKPANVLGSGGKILQAPPMPLRRPPPPPTCLHHLAWVVMQHAIFAKYPDVRRVEQFINARTGADVLKCPNF